MPLTDTEKVRLLVGDTDSSDQILSDTQISDFITDRSIIESGSTTSVNVVAAAADAAGAIAAKYARRFNFSEDGQTFQVAQRVGHYQALEKSLRARQGGASAAVTLAGTTTT
jgi:hypothetical protein